MYLTVLTCFYAWPLVALDKIQKRQLTSTKITTPLKYMLQGQAHDLTVILTCIICLLLHTISYYDSLHSIGLKRIFPQCVRVRLGLQFLQGEYKTLHHRVVANPNPHTKNGKNGIFTFPGWCRDEETEHSRNLGNEKTYWVCSIGLPWQHDV